MQPFQERLREEKDELDTRIANLQGFIAGEVFPTLKYQEQNRLRRQNLIMELYSDVLAERILYFES